MKSSILLTVAAALLFDAAAFAHHSLEVVYDLNQDVTVEGKLLMVLVRNPHSFLQLEVPDGNNGVERWVVEWRGAGGLAKQGILKDTLKTGDEVAIVVNPAFKKYDLTGNRHRGVLMALQRKSDGLQWSEKRRPTKTKRS